MDNLDKDTEKRAKALKEAKAKAKREALVEKSKMTPNEKEELERASERFSKKCSSQQEE